MKPIAAGLASLGRGGDSMLVHMQPREVAGLQRLAMAHGGSLTVNPETGLPEASFLGDVLGVVAPIALGAFLGPGAFGISGLGLSPLAAGLTTGLLGYAITGDPLKGLSAGLGGYGGAGLAGSLGSKGVVALTPEVTTVGSNVAPNIAGAAANSSVIPGSTIAEKIGVEGLAQNAGQGAVSSLSTVPAAYSTQAQMAGLKEVLANPFAKGNLMDTATLASPLIAAAAKPQPVQFPTAKEEKTPYEGPYVPTERQARFPTEEERRQLGTREFQYFNPVQPVPGYETYRGYEAGGAVNETPDPGSNTAQDARDADEYGLGGLAKFAEGGYASSYDVPSTEFQAQLDKYNTDLKDLMNPYGSNPYQNNIFYRPSEPVQNEEVKNNLMKFFSVTPFGALFNRGLTREQAIAKLGPAPVWNPTATQQNQTLQSAPGLTSQYQGTGVTTLPTTPAPRSPLLDMYTAAMLQGTPGFAKGGYLDGPGDGMSDSIPATIADKQPARLADGEFVVPADVVSHLGNGSTKAGAQRLYAMMDKVRKARTGTTKQGKQINPNKYLPA